ncbi:MAG: carboxypeptidase-like regulatory domain-containing protein [Planctomycetota bacterium]
MGADRRTSVGAGTGPALPEDGSAAGAIVDVEVVDEDGLGVPGVSVELRRAQEALAAGVSDELGRRRFTGLSPGPFFVHVLGPLPRGYLPPWKQDVVTPWGDGRFFAREHRVEGTGAHTVVVVTVFRAARVWGHVLGPAGEPVAGAHVTLAAWPAGLEALSFHAQTDAAGYFELADVYPNECRRQLSFEPGHAYAELARPFPDDVLVTPDSTISRTLQLGSGEVTVRGRVLDELDRPVPDLSVRLMYF